ncbi:MAG: carbohydrate-binding protein [Bacillota bacterium]
MKPIKPFHFSQEIHGVSVKPLTENGKEVRIKYKGLLASSGATDVVCHYGFGEVGKWQSIGNANMERTFDGWETSVSMQDTQLNFCFRDIADNWDNNNGLNWIYKLS